MQDPTSLEGISDPAPQIQSARPLKYDRTDVGDQDNLTAGIWHSQSEALSLSLGIKQDKLFGTDEQFRLGIKASNL